MAFVDEPERVAQFIEALFVERGPRELRLPPGYTLQWTGQYEFQVRARERLQILVPLVLFIIFMLLYLTFHSVSESVIVMLSVVYAMTGGVILQWWLGYNFSVAVWVGYIVCFGLATETGIVMLVYLREAIERRGGIEKIGSLEELKAAVTEGAVHRLRPKLLTESTTILGLVPMLVATGTGAEIMRPMAAPVLGGILLADEIIDVFIPVVFYWVRKGRWERVHA